MDKYIALAISMTSITLIICLTIVACFLINKKEK